MQNGLHALSHWILKVIQGARYGRGSALCQHRDNLTQIPADHKGKDQPQQTHALVEHSVTLSESGKVYDLLRIC